MMTDFSPDQDTKFLLGYSGYKKDTSEKPPTVGMRQQIPPASWDSVCARHLPWGWAVISVQQAAVLTSAPR